MKTFIIDAFTDRPFQGNPAGDCITDSQLNDDLMLNIAQELNHSETAFVRRLDGCGTFSIRFFSPQSEFRQLNLLGRGRLSCPNRKNRAVQSRLFVPGANNPK
jgi:PhzF family phenazine biosynthesis protein